MPSSVWLLRYLIGITFFQVVVALKCRTDHDLKNIEEFEIIVRNCLKTKWGESGNNGSECQDYRKDNNRRGGIESGYHSFNNSPSHNAFITNGDIIHNKDKTNKELNNRSDWNNQGRKGNDEQGSSTNQGYQDESNRSKSSVESKKETSEIGNSRNKSNSSEDDYDDEYYDEYDYGETSSDGNKNRRKPDNVNSKSNDSENQNRNKKSNDSGNSGGSSRTSSSSATRSDSDEDFNRGNRHKTPGRRERFDGGTRDEGVSHHNTNFKDSNRPQGQCRGCSNNRDNRHRYNADQFSSESDSNGRRGTPKRDQSSYSYQLGRETNKGNHDNTGQSYEVGNSDGIRSPNYNYNTNSHSSYDYEKYDNPEFGQTERVWNNRNSNYQPPVPREINPFFTNNRPPYRINNRGENYSIIPPSNSNTNGIGRYSTNDWTNGRNSSDRYSHNYRGRHGNSRNASRHENNDLNHGKTVSSLVDVEPCTIHCIFRQFRMVNGDSRLDKQRVADTLTRRARDPNLKQFIWHSVQHCFERNNLVNRDRCEGAKIFAICMEEAGKMNCEDWDFNKKFSDTHSNQQLDFNMRIGSKPNV